MAGTKTKSVSLTEKSTGTAFKIGANQIIDFYGVNSGADSSISYIENSKGVIRTMVVDQTPATINTAAAKTFSVTLTTGETLYIHADRVVYVAELASGDTQVSYYDQKAVLRQILVTDSAATVNTACGNTLEVTMQDDGSTRYINCNLIANITTEAVSREAILEILFGIDAASMTAPGTGYTSPPSVAIVGGGGSGATATAALGALSGVVTTPGDNYAPGDTIVVAGGTNTVDAELEVASTEVASFAVNLPGTGYEPADLITVAGGTAVTPAVLEVLTVKLSQAAVDAGGTGYVNGDTITLAGGTASVKAILTVDTTGPGGSVATFTISTAGSYTVTTPTFTQFSTTGIGTGATFNSALFGVLTADIDDAGEYTVNTASFTQASTTGAGSGFTANTVTYGAHSLSVAVNGEYSIIPSNPVSQASTTGSGTGIAATITWCVSAVNITAPGSGYSSQPTVEFTGGVGTGAAADVTMFIDAINVTDGGINYNSAPIITITGDGSGATATATVAGGAVTGVTVTAPGSGYTSASYSLSGGIGSHIIYDAKGSAFALLQVAETPSELQTAINAL